MVRVAGLNEKQLSNIFDMEWNSSSPTTKWMNGYFVKVDSVDEIEGPVKKALLKNFQKDAEKLLHSKVEFTEEDNKNLIGLYHKYVKGQDPTDIETYDGLTAAHWRDVFNKLIGDEMNHTVTIREIALKHENGEELTEMDKTEARIPLEHGAKDKYKDVFKPGPRTGEPDINFSGSKIFKYFKSYLESNDKENWIPPSNK